MIQGVPNSVRISENTSLKPHQMVVPNSMLDEIVESTRGKGFEIMSGNDSAVHLSPVMYNALVEKTEQAGKDTI